MFQMIGGIVQACSRTKGLSLLQLKCGHVKRAKFTGRMKRFCAWCASGTRPTSQWTPQTPHVHPRHLRRD